MEDPKLLESFQARTSFWSSIGQLDPDVLAPIINPSFTGGPKWPSLRQSFRKIVLNDNSVILASDGLSDPFPPESGKTVNGFEHEFYIHSDSLPDQVNLSWQFDMLNQMCQLAAANGGVRGQIDKYRYISVELVVKNIPPQFVSPQGRVGVLLGIPSKIIPDVVKLPLSEMKLISIILLSLKELDLVAQKGAEGRSFLAEKLISSSGTLSTIDRVSII